MNIELAIILVCILAISLILNIVQFIRTRRIMNKFEFDKDILATFDNWLFTNIGVYLSRFINEKTGRELLDESQLNLSSDFALKAIEYICKNLFNYMPEFYIEYMTKFHGSSDRLFEAITERVTDVVMVYIEELIKKRTGGRSTLEGINSVNKENQSNKDNVI